MAKKEKAQVAAKAAEPAKMITVKELAEEFNLEPRQLRVFLRGQGLKAPEVDNGGKFGPKAKYEWAEGSPELKTIREKIKEAMTETAE
jgi:hypothetical protein